jgi:hypothetical protein
MALQSARRFVGTLRLGLRWGVSAAYCLVGGHDFLAGDYSWSPAYCRRVRVGLSSSMGAVEHVPSFGFVRSCVRRWCLMWRMVRQSPASSLVLGRAWSCRLHCFIHSAFPLDDLQRLSMFDAPNKADAPNPAMTSLFHGGRPERGVGDRRRLAHT